jgi:two-component system sensor kinase FixL
VSEAAQAWPERLRTVNENQVYAAIFEHAAVAIGQLAPDGRFLRVNRAYSELTGYSAEELTRTDFQRITHPDDLGVDVEQMEDLLAGKTDRYAIDKRYVHKSGDIVWVMLTVALVRNARGEPDFFVSVAEKIDERKRAEAELAEREAVLRTIVETVPVGLVMAELPSGRVVSGNRYVESMLRHPVLHSPDIHSYDEWVSFHEDGTRVSGHEYPLARMVLHGEEAPSIDVNYRRGDGTFGWTRIVGRPVRNASGKLVGGVVALVDIDEERKAWDRVNKQLDALQSQLIHTSRLSAMGTMASSLAHEINQPLAAIANYLSGARRLLDSGEPGTKQSALAAMLAAERCATRAGDIIKGIRSMLTKGEVKPRPCLLTGLIQEAAAVALVGAESRGVFYWQDVAPDLAVQADPLQIQQVLINLVRNALDAFEGAPGAEIRVTASRDGDMVRISVGDNGPGLPESVRANLFEPFLSTKENGMGIGLSICRTIVEAHGGRIWFAPSRGSGTSVSFTLPVALP